MKKVRFGLVGCGRIADQHLNSIKKYKKRAKIVAVCDAVKKRARQTSANYKIKDWFVDYKKMLQRRDIDVVSICTPNGLHKDMAIKAAETGKHAIVEKPLAIKVKDIDEMITAFKKNKKNLFAVLQVRHNPPIRYTKNFIANKGLGKIYYANLTIRWYRPSDYFKESWRGTKKLDGGSLLNQGVHYIDILQWILGMPKAVFAQTLNLCHKIEIEDTVFAILQLKNRGWTSIEFTLCNYPKNSECSLSITGEKGNIKIGGAALDKIERWNVPCKREPKLEKSISPNIYANGMYQGSCPYHFLIYKNLLDVLQKNMKNQISGEEAKKSIQIIEAIYCSSAHEKKIRIL